MLLILFLVAIIAGMIIGALLARHLTGSALKKALYSECYAPSKDGDHTKQSHILVHDLTLFLCELAKAGLISEGSEMLFGDHELVIHATPIQATGFVKMTVIPGDMLKFTVKHVIGNGTSTLEGEITTEIAAHKLNADILLSLMQSSSPKIETTPVHGYEPVEKESLVPMGS